MARSLLVETGDVTLESPRIRRFGMSLADETENVRLIFDGAEAHATADDWDALIQQIKTRSLAKWKFTRMDPPLGQPDFQRLLAEVSNTPAYQLLLAGFDIAQLVGLVSNLDDQVVLSRILSLTRRVPNRIGQKGLFFVSDDLLSRAPSDAVDTLVLSNKLCRLQGRVAGFDPVTKYYIPYATPIELVPDATDRAQELWQQVRDYYYAFR